MSSYTPRSTPHPPASFGRGKVILLGEHAVVYGQPALAVALDRGAVASFHADEVLSPEVRLSFAPSAPPYTSPALTRAISAIAEATGAPEGNLSLTLDIPPSRGLGSSAALCVAAARAFLAAAGREETEALLEEAAGKGEAVFHGRPSGIDAAVSIRGKALLFRMEKEAPIITPLSAKEPFSLVVADTGARAPTSTLVEKIRTARESDPTRVEALFTEIGHLVREGARALGEGDLQTLGAVMNRNQEILAALGLSTPLLEEGILAARKAGALGAKLTGAGGGGCLVALCPPELQEEIRQRLVQTGCTPVEAKVDPALFMQR